jgi:molybdopterin biosynthesis enzyme MoaB
VATGGGSRLRAAVLTVSDSVSRGEKQDKSGPALKARLESNGWIVVTQSVVADETDQIANFLIRSAIPGRWTWCSQRAARSCWKR